MAKVAGFTIIKNAVLFDYPIIESIKSVLDLCDEFYVSIGKSDDDTEKLIQSMKSPKIKILHSVWDINSNKAGSVLADETNKVLQQIPQQYDWLFYIQADEVLHEKYIPVIQNAMQQYKDDKHVDGLLFNYKHFFGSYDYIGTSRIWYRREIRIIRQNPKIKSYLDAQGFRFANNTKLHVKYIPATIFHYGWVKHPSVMYKKATHAVSLYLSDEKLKKTEEVMAKQNPQAMFDYNNIDAIALFKETHPAVMLKRIQNKNWDYKPDFKKIVFKNKKHWFLHQIEKYLGYRFFEYKNYKII